jgi:quercetin dioxygenase-like cupin family protein
MTTEHWGRAQGSKLTESALAAKLDALGHTAARCVFPPGTDFPDHTHAADNIDAVLSGRFELTIHRKRAVLRAGDWLRVPRGVVHSARVLRDEPVVSLGAVRYT